jgi:protein-S-isoprenylcysteine O-methyltransferase Ste14
MRNPIRLKNLSLRLLPLYLIGLCLLVLYRPAKESMLAGLPVLVAGIVLRGWAAGHLVKNEALSLTGPYAHLRHPLYLGTMLIGTGFAIALGGWAGLLLVACFWPWFALHYFPRKERAESERLQARYGDRFARYRAAVPALWPRLHAWRDAPAAPARPSAAGTAPQAGWALSRYSENNELGSMLAVAAGWIVFWLRAAVA